MLYKRIILLYLLLSEDTRLILGVKVFGVLQFRLRASLYQYRNGLHCSFHFINVLPLVCIGVRLTSHVAINYVVYISIAEANFTSVRSRYIPFDL